jgi:hypothetical protein
VRRMQPIGYSLLFTVAIAAAAGDARADNGVTPVSVQNPITLNPATPNPVTVVNPQVNKVTPYSATQTSSGSALPGISVQLPLPLPPAGKLLIVEFFGVNCISSDGAITMRLAYIFQQPQQPLGDIPSNIYPANLPPTGPASGDGGAFVQFGQPMRFYVRPTDQVFQAILIADGPGHAACGVTVSGQLIDS